MKVNETSAVVNMMMPDWRLIEALSGGTGSMRAAREVYMPKRRLEETEDYEKRIGSAVLFPAFSETVMAMTGRVFARPFLINEDVPDWLKDDVFPDCDLLGTNFQTFMRNTFAEALRYGHRSILVEAPVVTGPVSVQDEKDRKLKPYLISIHPRRVLGWREDYNGGLTQVRIMFYREVIDGEFGTMCVPQVRVYEPNLCRVYEQVPNNKEEWYLYESWPMDGVIPLVTLYTAKKGVLRSEPPLRELAYLNSKHWRVQSSMDSLLDTASVPILVLTGITDDTVIQIGAKQAIQLPMGAEAQFCEHSGKAIDSGRSALKDLLDEMRLSGARLTQVHNPGTKTAKQAGEEAASENSPLAAMVTDYEAFGSLIINVLRSYREKAKGGTIRCQPNLAPDFLPADTLRALLDMANSGKLSDQTLFGEAQRRGLIAEELLWEDESDRIQAQPPSLQTVIKKSNPGNPENVKGASGTGGQGTPPQ